MADNAAERQRRSRRHRAGDHSLCDRDRCAAGELRRAVTRDGVTEPSVRLRARGLRLWQDLVADGEPGPMERVLIEEVCRLADRLDRFDGIVSGRDRAWLTLELGEDQATVEVIVDKVLAEARQQQVAFRALLAELRQVRAVAPSAPARAGGRKAPAAPAAGGGGVADLTARIAARSPQTAG